MTRRLLLPFISVEVCCRVHRSSEVSVAESLFSACSESKQEIHNPELKEESLSLANRRTEFH